MKQNISLSYQLLLTLPVWTRFLVAVAIVASIPVEQYWDYRYDTTSLRLMVAAGMLLFVYHKYWPTILLPIGPMIWNAWLVVCLPFTFGTIMLQNAALTPVGEPLDILPLTEYSLCLMFMIWSHRGLPLALINWLFGTAGAFATLLFVEAPNLELLSQTIFTALPFVVTIFMIGGITNNASFKFQQEKEQAIWRIANSIAHQLRTPLATIQNISSGTMSNFDKLVLGYQLAVENKHLENEVTESKMHSIKNSFKEISQEAEEAKTLISILIQNSRPFTEVPLNSEPVSIKTLIDKAVEGFPYNNPSEKLLVSTSGDDYLVDCDQNMMLHVIYNLIANGVEFAQKRKSGNVNITTRVTQKWNELCVRDTGIGISADHLSRVFDPFFSHNSMNGTGIGLSFCKSVVEGLGGKISVSSIPGEFTEFTIRLPKVLKTPS